MPVWSGLKTNDVYINQSHRNMIYCSFAQRTYRKKVMLEMLCLFKYVPKYTWTDMRVSVSFWNMKTFYLQKVLCVHFGDSITWDICMLMFHQVEECCIGKVVLVAPRNGFERLGYWELKINWSPTMIPSYVILELTHVSQYKTGGCIPQIS